MNWFKRKKKNDDNSKLVSSPETVSEQLSNDFGFDIYIRSFGDERHIIYFGILQFNLNGELTYDNVIKSFDEEFDYIFINLNKCMKQFNTIYKDKIRDKKLKDLGI